MAHRNMEITKGSSSKNWQSNQQNKSMTGSSSSSKSRTPTFDPLCIIDPLTGRRYKRFEDMYTMSPLRGLVKQGSSSNNNNNNNNVSNLDSQQTSLGGNINISGASMNLGQIGSSSYNPQGRSTFRSYPSPSQYVEPGLSAGVSGHQDVNNANVDVNIVWDPKQSSNNFQIGPFSQTPFFERQTIFPSMVELVPQNGGNHSAHLNQEPIIISEAEANRSTLFEIAKELGVSLDSPSPNNQQDNVDLLYSTSAPSSPTSGLIRPQTFPYGDQLHQFPVDAFDHVSTIPEIPEQSIVIPQFPMEASFQPNTALIPQSTQQEYGVVSAGISLPSLSDFPSFFSHQGSSSVTTAVSVPSLPDFPPFFPHQESDVVTSGVSVPNLPEFPPSFTDQGSGNFTHGVSIPAVSDFPQTFTHQGNNNKGGMTIQALENILEAEDNMGRNNMNTSVQWTPPMGNGIVNGAYDTIFVELGQPVDPHLRFFMNMQQGNSSKP